MIRYEVTLLVEPALQAALSHYMRGEHIAEVLETGCFESAHFDAGNGTFRTSYLATSQADLDRYLAEHASRLRENFARHFPEGVSASRAVWETLQGWDRPDPQ